MNKKRNLWIGDIHNNPLGILDCLDKAQVTTEDSLGFIGDYFDGWMQAKETAEILMKLDRENDCIFLMGNHDAWVLNWLRTGYRDPSWLKHGGQNTLNSLSDWFEDEPIMADELMMFMNKFHYYYVDDENRGFVHGGYTSHDGLGNDDLSTYLWDRSLMYNSFAMFEEDKSKEPRLNAHKEVYIGHTSTVNWDTSEPMILNNLINLDTGSGWNGKLTIMDIDTKEFWQSKNSKLYYPTEIGR